MFIEETPIAPPHFKLLLLGALAVVPAGASAQDAWRVEVRRSLTARSCPEETALREAVRSILHDDPFDGEAPRRASVQFSRAGRVFLAEVRVHGSARSAVRRLRSVAPGCQRLADATALVLALAIDPARALLPAPENLAASSPPPGANPGVSAPSADVSPPAPATPVTRVTPDTPPSPPPSPPPRAPPATSPPTPPPSDPLRVELSLLAALGWGLTPGLAGSPVRPGARLQIALAHAWWAVPVEVGVDAPGQFEDASRGASAEAVPTYFSAGFCGRWRPSVELRLCALSTAALVYAYGAGYMVDRNAAGFALAFGARVGVTVPFRTRWAFTAAAEVSGMALRPTLRVEGAGGGELWDAPVVSAGVALGVTWRIH